ncbi:hypothetical protein C2845_PM16G18770 [Panicum miliaceum]|uniref:Uncharacterized protein n=1 Tax=Panicum miliaceum TaxID=4540 RepID=A0A3L6PZH1_PANMI|nr:hypothetical protein C2845_PM16G18770 [Panicum miliaceum]
MVDFIPTGTEKGGEKATVGNNALHSLELVEGTKQKNFDGVTVLPTRILSLIKEEMQLRFAACGQGDNHLV